MDLRTIPVGCKASLFTTLQAYENPGKAVKNPRKVMKNPGRSWKVPQNIKPPKEPEPQSAGSARDRRGGHPSRAVDSRPRRYDRANPRERVGRTAVGWGGGGPGARGKEENMVENQQKPTNNTQKCSSMV